MESRNVKFEVFNGKIEVPAGNYHYLSHRIIHVGKSNHHIKGSFSVSQGQENVASRIHLYVFSERQFFDWFFKHTGSTSYNFFNQKEGITHYEDRVNGNFSISVKGDVTFYFVCSNHYLFPPTKHVDLNIIEEWDEEIQPTDVVTTLPPHDQSLKMEIEELITKSKESLKIISPYMDMTLINNLLQKQSDGVNIQIILRKDKEVKGLAKDGLNQIRKHFPHKYRLNEDIHSRVIIKDDKEALISSADLTQKSLQAQINLGIRISDPKIVGKIIRFFQKIWTDSRNQ